MTPEVIQFTFLVAAWIPAFLLGKELQKGYKEWREKATEKAYRRRD